MRNPPATFSSVLEPKEQQIALLELAQVAIERYFNTLLSMERSGTGSDVERFVNTAPTNMLDLKNPIPYDLPEQVPIATGIATIFELLKGGARPTA